ncbi:succinylglutamate desuccinylase/aspartoacylase domain-containing protein [Aliikangiella coralliicola]|nr:succinylglutamate desuccinylase/aspartoacylase family protein [Aliikangiella coralliicola]
MNLLNPEVKYFDDDFRSQIEPTALGFLRQLNGLTIFDLKGKDTSRTRVITTLIHGNEPSGFIASHLWLRSKSVPLTNIRIVICNPEAARTKPIFTNRYLARSQDLNRVFSAAESDTSEVANRARQIKRVVSEVSPEAIIDMHNTSGVSPAFGVAVNDSEQVLDLVSLFTNKLILTGLSIGAIMEESFNAPIATIECGGSNDIYSHQVATDGLHEYFTRENIFDQHADRVQVHRHPIRVELVGDASVGFSHHSLPTTDITLRADIEQLNRQITPAGEFIGWCSPEQALPLKAIDEQGVDQIEQLLELKNGCLFAKQNMHMFMITTTLEIATNDCLFYATLEE